MKAKNTMWKKDMIVQTASAKVVDGHLILTLPDAANPVVWRMDLTSIKSSALEVKTLADGSFMLSLKTPKGDVYDIAAFPTRDGAVSALMHASAALQSAESRTTTAQPIYAAPVHAAPVFEKSGGSAYKWVIALVGVIGVIVLFAYISSMAPRAATGVAGASVTPTPGAPGASDSGVPQSADQILRGM